VTCDNSYRPDLGVKGSQVQSCQPDGDVTGQGLNPRDRIEALDVFWGPIGGQSGPDIN
jgi:hypothetical protein